MKSVLTVICLSLLFASLSNAAQTRQATGPDPQERAKAYEESCILALRTINVAQGTYWGGDPAKGYARTLEELGPTGAGLFEAVLASGNKDGYRFRLNPERAGAGHLIKHNTVTARPIKRLVKNQRSFFTDETGVIRFTIENRAATAVDPPLDSALKHQVGRVPIDADLVNWDRQCTRTPLHRSQRQNEAGVVN